VFNEKLIRFLDKDNVSHRLVHTNFELLKFLLLVEESLFEERSIEVQVFLCVALRSIIKVNDLEHMEKESVVSNDVEG
jgi:hypothetical protein